MICPMGLAACPPKQKVMVCFFTLMMEKSKPLKYLFLYNLLSAQESNLIGNKCFAYPFDIITWIYYSNYTYIPPPWSKYTFKLFRLGGYGGLLIYQCNLLDLNMEFLPIYLTQLDLESLIRW